MTRILFPLVLSLMGGVGTALGGVFVVIQQKPSLKTLGTLQGVAAGMMLSLSFLDLMHNATNAIGFTRANFWFFGGVVVIAAIVLFIPEPSLEVPERASKPANREDRGDGDKHLLKAKRKQVWLSGIITAVGISLHNFPEGMAVFLGSVKGVRIGLSLALAIGLHNIPEGVAVALPVYFATESKWQGLKLATLSGLAEPMGVVLVGLFFPSSLSPDVLEGLLGADLSQSEVSWLSSHCMRCCLWRWSMLGIDEQLQQSLWVWQSCLLAWNFWRVASLMIYDDRADARMACIECPQLHCCPICHLAVPKADVLSRISFPVLLGSKSKAADHFELERP